MSGSVYPRWEREDRVSRFFVGPSLPIYQIPEIPLIGGSMFVAFASDKANLVANPNPRKMRRKPASETSRTRERTPATETVRWGLNPGQKRG